MPELPEVETVRRGLVPLLENTHIVRVELRRADLRFPFPVRMVQRLTNVRVTGLRRRAKYLLFDLDSGETLLVHLGMTGSLTLREGAFKTHDHVVFHLRGGGRLCYHDPRRFGFMDFVGEETFANLGPEPLEQGFTAKYLCAALQRKKGPIKPAIMDQRVVVGVGNIYASESLFLAGISPFRPANALNKSEYQALVKAIRATLQAAIESGGSTLRDYVQATGEPGYFQHAFKVYEREGMPCLCAAKKSTLKLTPLVKKCTQQGRATYYCSVCQK